MLQERAAGGQGICRWPSEALHKMLHEETTAPFRQQLRALWALHDFWAVSPRKNLLELLDHKEESVRGWAIRLLLEEPQGVGSGAGRSWSSRGRHDASPLVRLALASALQRLPLEQPLESCREVLACPWRRRQRRQSAVADLVWCRAAGAHRPRPGHRAAGPGQASHRCARNIARRLVDMAE